MHDLHPPRVRRRRWRRGGGSGGALLALAVLAMLSPNCYGIREDELRCEEAVSRLVECCPGFEPSAVDCNYFVACNTEHFPRLRIEESRCIVETLCDDLRRQGTCERVTGTSEEACP